MAKITNKYLNIWYSTTACTSDSVVHKDIKNSNIFFRHSTYVPIQNLSQLVQNEMYICPPEKEKLKINLPFLSLSSRQNNTSYSRLLLLSSNTNNNNLTSLRPQQRVDLLVTQPKQYQMVSDQGQHWKGSNESNQMATKKIKHINK